MEDAAISEDANRAPQADPPAGADDETPGATDAGATAEGAATQPEPGDAAATPSPTDAAEGDGDAADGDAAEGDEAEGDAAQADAAEGDAAEGDAAEGDAAQADAAQADAAQADAAEADAAEGDAAQADAAQADAAQADASEGDAAEGDAAEGDAVQADAAEGDVAEGDTAEAAPEPQEPPPPPPDPRELRIRYLERAVEEKDQTLREYIRAHKKAGAEFEAFKARMKRDHDGEIEAAKARIIELFLDVADNLERMLEAARQDAGGGALKDGVELVHKQFYQKFEELGLERYDPTGEVFDPTSMNALAVVPVQDEALDGKVVMTLSAGYRLGERELRAALVQVGRKA